MARNTYFSQGSEREANLYEDLIIESLKIYGQDVYYIPRTIVSEDKLFNEDIESKFDFAYLIEMYLENTDSFEGDGTLLSKFGLELRDQASFIVAKKTFESSVYGTTHSRPNEGDLIYLTLSKSLFEIKFVEHEQPFYQLQNLPVYKLQCELFEYTGEDIDTGIAGIDKIQEEFDTRTNVNFTYGGSEKFSIGEDVNITYADGGSGTAEVLAADNINLVLSLGQLAFTDGQVRVIGSGAVITGVKSGAVGNVGSIVGLSDSPAYTTYTDDPYDDNSDFEIIGNNFVDFSEINPFGEINL